MTLNVTEPLPLRKASSDEHARAKAAAFPDKGGPVILVVDVPDDIIAKAINEWFQLIQGLVQFDPGAGLEELTATWPSLSKKVADLERDLSQGTEAIR